MDANNTAIIISAIFALIVVAIVLVFRQQIEVKIKGFLGMEMDVKASNPSQSMPGGALIEDVEAGGDARAKTSTGGDAIVRRTKAEGDVEATSSKSSKEHSDPKA